MNAQGVAPPGTTIEDPIFDIIIDIDGFPSVTIKEHCSLFDPARCPFPIAERVKFYEMGTHLRTLITLYGSIKFDRYFSENECKAVLKEEYDLCAQLPRPEDVKMSYSFLSQGKIQDNDWEGFYKFITGNLTPKQAKHIHAHEEPGKDFGAPTTHGTIFQMYSLWNARAKAMPLMYLFFDEATSILPTIDRVSRLLQPTGSNKPTLVHWDGDPRKMDSSINELPGIMLLADVLPGMQGLALVPGSNTLEFFDKLRQDYSYLFPPESTPIRTITNLDAKQPDPLNLMKRKISTDQLMRFNKNKKNPISNGELCQITGKQGTMVFFSEAVIHGVLSRLPVTLEKTCRIRHAAYIGAIKREEDDLLDRKKSYETGEAPLRHPSGSMVNYHQPPRFVRDPSLAERFQNIHRTPEWRGMRTLDAPREGETTCAVVATLIPIPPTFFDYTPVPLTPFLRTLIPLEISEEERTRCENMHIKKRKAKASTKEGKRSKTTE